MGLIMVDASPKGKGRGVTVRLGAACCGTMSFMDLYDIVHSATIWGQNCLGSILTAKHSNATLSV